MEYEVINFPAAGEAITEYRFVESDWIVCADGISRTAWEYNRKTGEYRAHSYEDAMRALYS